ncbi:hypothetical protein [Vibrio pectenicida]|uniref:Uncharacterized protein n=1 Tax=Vibrio pectenicida TaxID=62763 RepID=A0A3R9FMV7_9VIBR|nr:hypothetical protein [Vibrio pectenicida]RSD31721.1 hypothetical protein EJA03_07285 [Vibrio pectenicida]
MDRKFSNQAIEVIAAKPEVDSTLLEVVYRVSTKIDSDLDSLESMTNGSGFKGVDSSASVYRSAIQDLQLFNDLFDSNKPLKALFDGMRAAVYEYKSKV